MSWWPPPLYLVLAATLATLVIALLVVVVPGSATAARRVLWIETAILLALGGFVVAVYFGGDSGGENDAEIPASVLELELAGAEDGAGHGDDAADPAATTDFDRAMTRLWVRLYWRVAVRLEHWSRGFGLVFAGVSALLAIALLAAKGAPRRGLLALLAAVDLVVLVAIAGIAAFV